MRVLDEILTSGHDFSENDSLQKFRFAVLNVFILFPALPAITNLSLSYLGIVESGSVFEIAIVFFIFILCVSFFSLRRKKSNYSFVVWLYLVATIIGFFAVLFVRDDELRLIAFIMALFIAYALLGKKLGALIALFLAVSISVISKSFDLGISPLSYNTFFTFLIGFAVLFYFFLEKIEKDAHEFKQLRNKLEQRVIYEMGQREMHEQMLLRRSRMANMGEMLDSIAHQWRQPLMHINSILLNMENAIDPNSQHSENRTDLQEYLQDKIDEVALLTTHMSQTISDFRGLFHDNRDHTEFSIKDVVTDVLALMKNSCNNIEIKKKFDTDVSIRGQRSELMQVFIIVLNNAIEVLSARESIDKRIAISVGRSNDEVVISIGDNAGGINTEKIGRIFDPYVTTKEQSGGTGLGLYIAKIIVEHNFDGEICASNTREGASFSIKLPAPSQLNPV